MNMETDDEEDPVVDEVDVFLSKELAEKLYVFQYPVRPASSTYTHQEHLAARIKPKQKKIELDVAIDTTSPSYSKSKGQQIALNVDGSESTEERFYNSRQMDKQVFSSSNASPSTARYAVGVLRNGELHLTPVHGIIQLRPNFKYLDQADLKVRQQSKGADGDDELQEEGEKEDIKPIKVQLIRQESDQAKARRMASFAYHMEKMEEEKWVECDYVDETVEVLQEETGCFVRTREERIVLSSCRARDISTHNVSKDFIATEENKSSDDLKMLKDFLDFKSQKKQKRDYLAKLIPESSEGTSSKAQLPSNVLSISQLKTMPLLEQVKALLTNAKVLKFSQLMRLLQGAQDPASVLKAVQQVAVMVQGCWVVKSDILYPKDTQSPSTGVSADLLRRGRDYLMWRFTQSRCVVRKEIASIIKLLSEDMKEILEQMARPKVNLGWEFCEEFDTEFVKKNPDIVQRQEMIWNAMYQKLMESLKLPKADEKKLKGKKKDGVEPIEIVTGEEGIKTARKRSRSTSQLSPKGTHSSTSTHNAISSNSTSFDPNIQIKTEPMDTSESNHIQFSDRKIPERAEQSVVPTDANGESGHTHKTDLKEALSEFLLKKFKEQGVMTTADMRKLLNVRLMESTPDDVLKGSISDSLLAECALNCGAEPLEISWSADEVKLKDRKVFGLRHHGDVFDVYRGVLLDFFKHSHRAKRTALEEIIKDVKVPSSKAEMDRIIKSVCVRKGNHWILKGLLPPS